MLVCNYDYGYLPEIVFVVLVCAGFYWVMRSTQKVAKKRRVSIQCQCCANRGGAYPPKNCPNRCCKYYR